MIPEYPVHVSAKIGVAEEAKLVRIKQLTGMTTSAVIRHLLNNALVPVTTEEFEEKRVKVEQSEEAVSAGR